MSTDKDESDSVEKEVIQGVENITIQPEKEKPEQNRKIDILLHATGNAPILKQKKWSVDPEKTISSINKFIHKYLKLGPDEKLFLYINQTFAPAPDQIIKNLYDCYETNGKLVLHYAKSQAWG